MRSETIEARAERPIIGRSGCGFFLVYKIVVWMFLIKTEWRRCQSPRIMRREPNGNCDILLGIHWMVFGIVSSYWRCQKRVVINNPSTPSPWKWLALLGLDGHVQLWAQRNYYPLKYGETVIADHCRQQTFWTMRRGLTKIYQNGTTEPGSKVMWRLHGNRLSKDKVFK